MRAVVRRARVERRCDDVEYGYDDCRRLILPGEQYARCTVSPHHDDYGNEGWWVSRHCIPCARRYSATYPPAVLASAS